MYLDRHYFTAEATAIVGNMSIKYATVKSGWQKGYFFAKMQFPANVKYDDEPEYLQNLFGDSRIPSRSERPEVTKEEARQALIKTVAGYLSTKDKQNKPQYFSDLHKYYISRKDLRSEDIYFVGEIGRSAVNYFRLLAGTINEENWKNKLLYEGTLEFDLFAVINIKELYYALKQNAKAEWLENNKWYQSKVIGEPNPILSTFKFDEDKIEAVNLYEQKFLVTEKQNSSTIEGKDNGYLSKLKTMDLSKIANTGNVKVGYRKDKFLNGNIIVGRERELVFPNDQIHKSYFAVVELFDIVASHNEETFGNSKDYPTDESGKNVNDRNYTGDKNAQAKVVSVAQKLNPNIIVSTSATASGTPIISIDGMVVSGNNRTMSLKLALSRYAEKYEQYKKVLFSELEYGGYGISMAQTYSKFKQPVLVRIDVDFTSYTSTELNAFNKPRSKSEKNIDRAIRLSKQIKENDACQNAMVQLVSEQEVVSELYNDRSAVNRFKKLLIECNIISENEISAFFTDFSLTDTGKILYETLLVSLILSPAALEISQNAGVKSATNAIVNAIIPLIKNKLNPEALVIEDVNNALLIQNAMVSNDYKKLSEFITENTMFSSDEGYKTERGFIINWYLNQRVNDFKSAMLKYNNAIDSNAGGSLFGDSLSTSEIFQSIFTKNVDADVIKSIETFKRNSTTTQEAVNVSSNQTPSSPIKRNEELLLSRLQKASKYL